MLTIKGYTHSVPAMCMDYRHVQAIHWLLLTYKPASVLEIGCFHGYSTTAVLDASRQFPLDVHLCDIVITPELRQLIADYDAAPMIHQCPSVAAIPRASCQWAIVDGDHALPTVSREVELLADTATVIAHDTNVATALGWVGFDGAEHLKRHYQADGRYRCYEDCQVRPGEWTERGFFVATREDLDLVTLANVINCWAP